MTATRAFTVDHEPAPFVRATQGEIRFAAGRRNATRGKPARLNRYWAFKEAVARAYQSAHPGADWLTGDLSLLAIIFWPAGRHRRFDLVNIFKAVEDALNGVAYKDDVAITHGRFWIEAIAPDQPPSVAVILGPHESSE